MTALAFILVIFFTIAAILNFPAALYEIIWGNDEDKAFFILSCLRLSQHAPLLRTPAHTKS